MKYNEENNGYILDSGKTFQAYKGILGIGSQVATSIIFHGYDSIVFVQFTTEERKEIAEYMINLWSECAKGT